MAKVVYQNDFIKYLNNLQTDRLFDCKFLRVLPEEVSLEGAIYYDSNEFICMKSVQEAIRQDQLDYCHCKFIGNLKLDSQGRLEIACRWSTPLLNWKIKVIE